MNDKATTIQAMITWAMTIWRRRPAMKSSVVPTRMMPHRLLADMHAGARGCRLIGQISQRLRRVEARQCPALTFFQKKGNNKCTSSCCAEIGFAATAGWDPVTGLGTRAIRYAVKAYIRIAYGNLGWIVNIFSKKPRTRIHTTNMYCEVRSSRLSGS